MRGRSGRNRALLRLFLQRAFNTGLMSSEGDAQRLTVTVVSLLAGASLTLSALLIIRYLNLAESPEAAAALPFIEWRDKGFLIGLSMLATSLALGFTFQTMFPDRQDAWILGAQPVPPWTLFWTRAAAAMTAPAICAVAINSITGLVFPAISVGYQAGLGDWLIRVAAHNGVCLLAAAFVAGLTWSVQGLLVNVLPPRAYRVAAPAVQLSILAWTILDCVAGAGAAAGGWHDLAPSRWYLALYQAWTGDAPVMAAPPADWALGSAAGLMVAGCGLFGAGYRRTWRQAAEGAGSQARGPGWVGRAVRAVLRMALLRKTEQEAAFYFVWRTISRNQKYRFLLTLYVSVGASIVAGGLESLAHHSEGTGPTAMAVSLPLEFGALLAIGLRTVMPVPVELPANWVFRMNTWESPEQYQRAVRALAIVITVTAAVLAPLPAVARSWGWATAIEIAGLESFVFVVLVRALFAGYHQIPFTCPYVPDKANLRVRFGWYAAMYLFLVTLISHAVTSELQGATPGLTLVSLLAIAYWAFSAQAKRKLRTVEGVPFEDGGPASFTVLEVEPR